MGVTETIGSTGKYGPNSGATVSGRVVVVGGLHVRFTFIVTYTNVKTERNLGVEVETKL